MVGIDNLFDKYGFRARFLPALLVTTPIAVVVALLFPALYASYKAIFSSLGVTLVALFVLAHVIRTKGRSLENRLYQAWGGVPTTTWLRHRDERLDPHTKDRYHKFLAGRIPNLKVPSAAGEQADPQGADRAYASAVKWLLEHTRDAGSYALVFEENVSYGFRRNMLAAKPLALSILCILAGIATWVSYRRFDGNLEHLDVDTVAAWIVVICGLALWFMVTKAWVKDASDSYARALLAACDKA